MWLLASSMTGTASSRPEPAEQDHPAGRAVRGPRPTDQSSAYVRSRATESDAVQAKVLTEDEARGVACNLHFPLAAGSPRGGGPALAPHGGP
jgi:hypothetical protein